MPLIIHTVSDAVLETMPDVDQPLFQFIDLMNFRLADRPGFVEDMTKTFFVFFCSRCICLNCRRHRHYTVYLHGSSLG